MKACRQAAQWRASGWSELVMAVNLSAVQFRDPNLGQEVMAILAQSGLDPVGLELELTESLLLQSEGSVLATLLEWNRGAGCVNAHVRICGSRGGAIPRGHPAPRGADKVPDQVKELLAV